MALPWPESLLGLRSPARLWLSVRSSWRDVAERSRRAREAGLNVLLVTVDTLRADALGAYGSRSAQLRGSTGWPRAGVRFETAHAHNVMTLASHANILSGRLPTDHGVRDNAGFRFPAAAPNARHAAEGRAATARRRS